MTLATLPAWFPEVGGLYEIGRIAVGGSAVAFLLWPAKDGKFRQWLGSLGSKAEETGKASDGPPTDGEALEMIRRLELIAEGKAEEYGRGLKLARHFVTWNKGETEVDAL